MTCAQPIPVASSAGATPTIRYVLCEREAGHDTCWECNGTGFYTFPHGEWLVCARCKIRGVRTAESPHRHVEPDGTVRES